MRWVDTHVHLDAPEFDADRRAVRQQARDAGVAHCVIPAVERSNFDTVRKLAHAEGDSYCLGIHPLYVAGAQDADLVALDEALTAHAADPRLVAVGEIGLDYFVPALCKSPLRERQEALYRQQLKLARKHGLPVVLHVRKSADRLLKHLREVAGPNGRWQGIAHAFNGSEVQAAEFIKLGFKLGFGGAVTFDRALQLRHLAKTLPLDALVLETDAPDIQPHWLYTTAEQRAAGHPQGRNAPAELPRIAECIAEIRGISVDALAAAALHNSLQALPKLGALLV
ncbi:MAG: TatD family deoxyribonuclease [Betaproteobacteria bacterium]|nr:TatD family deoxyribonuclease [Betaproteobacteria bacterium]